MKKQILFLAACLLLQLSSTAQNSLQLNINHKLADVDFVINMGAKNNLDHDFNVSRLQYYISDISIKHDDDVTTSIEDHVILVNARTETVEILGDYNIDQVESISFYVGVNQEVNHDDPASFANNHPLAPQFPSMHWGWAAGYRFLAIEGKGGSNYNQLFQLHGLGDSNYYKTEIPVTATAVDNQIVINIDADYTRVLENIEVNNGVIVHGDYDEAQKALQNFRDYVFSQGALTSVNDFEELNRFDVFPNPTNNGQVSIALSTTEAVTYDLIVSDLLGRPLYRNNAISTDETITVHLNHSGVYFAQLIKDGGAVMTKKIIVQ